jgi:beta-galactosidase
MRSFLIAILLTITITASAQPGTGTPTRNDHIFPSAAAAKPYINYDARGFLINGKRVFIASAGMEYARVPRALWHDRLLRLKRAGFNAVEMYTFWNFHEAKEGQFNFTGDHDLDAYLKLIKSMGMYAIVRVGPYYCGEWNMGGYPIWLKFKPGLRVREDNAQFITAVDNFFNKLIPIVAQNQINHGGSVIMVQLENEHRAGWGTVVPNKYFQHLKDKTVGLGLQVPYFFSGLHSGNDPSGDFTSLDDPARPNPWFAPEYWGVWFLNYGPQELDSTLYDRRTWKMLAHGGNGYNVYMAHGGSNFDYNNDRENAASYDYGAAIGQTGDLRPIYYAFKRANWFAHSFQDILENSLDAKDDLPTVTDTMIKVTVRKSPAGSVAFLDNQDTVARQFNFVAPANIGILSTGSIKLAPGEIMPVVQNYQISNTIKLLWAPVRIYARIPQGNTTTLVISGAVGSETKLYFFTNGKTNVLATQQNFRVPRGPGLITFNARVTDSPAEYNLTSGHQSVKIIVISDQMAARTWFADANGQTHIIIGPDYAADLISKNNHLNLTTEQPWLVHNSYPTWIFKPVGFVMKPGAPVKMVKRMVTLNPGQWQIKSASAPALPNYDDSGWLQSKDPLQMGADGDITAYAWYRTKIKVAQAGNHSLTFKNAPENGALFLDGTRVDTAARFQNEIHLALSANVTYTIAVFTSHIGRNKLIFKIGRIDTLDMKGLSGPVMLQKADGSGTATKVENWKMRGGPGEFSDIAGWQQLPAKSLNRPQFFRAALNLSAQQYSNTIWRVNTTSLSYGSVWVNGHNLGRYPEKIKINGMYIPACWLKPGKNTLVIYDEAGVLPNDVRIEAEQAASREIQTLQF